MATFNIKQNDTSPALSIELSPSTLVLTGGAGVFSMRDRRGTVKINRQSVSITDDGASSDTPTVQYDWSAGDTDTVGTFYGEVEFTYADSTVETFPNSGYIVIQIDKEIA